MKILKCFLWVFICALACASALSDDTVGDLEQQEMKAKELTKAMQRAQLLLSDVSAIFECNYASYDVKPTTVNNNKTYFVVIDVEENDCDAMVAALNEQGTKDKLHFVSEKKMPEMNALPEPGPAPYDHFNNPPTDYRLIHEVDPAEEQM